MTRIFFSQRRRDAKTQRFFEYLEQFLRLCIFASLREKENPLCLSW